MRSRDELDSKVYQQADQERRDFLLSLIRVKAAEYIEGPYANYDILWERRGIKERFFSSGYFLEKSEYAEMGLEENHLPEITLARWTAARHVAERLNELGITAQDCSTRTGIQKATLSRYSTGQRAFALELEQAAPLCNFVLRESINKVYFGFDGQIILPNIYSGVMKLFCALSDETRQRLAKEAESMKADWERLNPATFGIGHHRDTKELMCRRMNDLRCDSGRTVMEFIRGERAPRFLRLNMRYYFEEEYRSKSVAPKISFLAFLALELRMPLDYFLAEDYTAFVPCYYKDGSNIIRIDDLASLRFLGALTSVDEETSAKMSAPVLWEYYKSRK